MSTATAEVIQFPGGKGLRKMPKWSAKRRAKFLRTMRRKAKERLRAERTAKPRGSKGGKTIARARAGNAVRQASKGGIERAIGLPTEAQDGRKARDAGEERLDAIAYLRAATEEYAHVPTSVCYALLALRRLERQIK